MTARGTGLQPVPEVPTGKLPVPRSDSSRQMTGFTARLAVILFNPEQAVRRRVR